MLESCKEQRPVNQMGLLLFFGSRKYYMALSLLTGLLQSIPINLFPIFFVKNLKLMIEILLLLQLGFGGRNPQIQKLNSHIYRNCYIIFGLCIFMFVFNFLNSIINSVSSNFLTFKLRNSFFKVIINKDLEYFDQQDITPIKLNQDLEQTCQEITVMMSIYLSSVMNLAGSLLVGLSIAFFYSPFIALFGIFSIPMFALGFFIRLQFAI